MKQRPALLVISQVYPPDGAAVGRPLADVAEEMARRGWRVLVVTAANGYENPTVRYPSRETLRGVRVWRLPVSSFGKATLMRRLLGGGLFVTQALACGLFVRGAPVVLVSTSPPFAGFAGVILTWLRGLPAVWWVMDLNPDQIVAAGQLAPQAWPVRLFRTMNRITLRLAARVIVLDRFMRERLAVKIPQQAPGARPGDSSGVGGRISPPARAGGFLSSRSIGREPGGAPAEGLRSSSMHVIPPWSAVRPSQWRPSWPNAFREAHGLERKFVVMYSGNHALQHPLDTPLAAAAQLEHDRDIVFVWIGGGAGKGAIEAQIHGGAPNLVSLPFQPPERLDETLAAADVHMVSMGNDVVGIVHPCKIYGALAVGRPVLFFGPADSPPGELLATIGVGRCVEHGDVAGAVAAIAGLRSLAPETRAAMGQAAARAIATRFGACELCRDVCEVIETSRGVRGINTRQSPAHRFAGSCAGKSSHRVSSAETPRGRRRTRH
jgi:colanic acid biosynthesis glycosyl transferase WcaI